MKTRALAVISFLAVAGIVGFVARGGAHPSETGGNASGAASLAEGGPGLSAPSPAPNDAAGKVTVARPYTALSLGPSAIPGIGPKVIKEATVALRVKRGGLQQALAAATATAGRYGGFVEAASSRDRAGSIRLRIPETSFEQALAALRGLGTVSSSSVSGQDVTSQFVDLNARLITWRSQEAVLLRLMGRATSISDTLRIQTQLQQVQVRIEQIRGALRVLHNQTSYGTIDLGIREVGAPVVKTQSASTPSLARAWQQAWAGCIGVVSAVIVGLGYLVPLGLLALAGWAVYRRVARPRAVPAGAAS